MAEDVAAHLAVAGLAVVVVPFVGPRQAAVERERARGGAFAILGEGDDPFARGQERGDRGIAVRGDVEVDRNLQVEPEPRGAPVGRRQQAAPALHAWVGMGEIGRIGDRNTEELEHDTAVHDALAPLVVDDLGGPYLP